MDKKINILAINFGGLGDEILFLPALKSIKEHFDAEITLALEPRSKAIKELSDIPDNIIEVDIKKGNVFKEIKKFLRIVKKQNFDLAISSGSSPLVSILLFLTGIKKRYGYDSGYLSRKLLTKTIQLNKNQYAAKMYHDLAKTIVGNNDFEQFELKILKEALSYWSRGSIKKNGKPVIAIHPGVSKLSVEKKMVKNYSYKKFADVINKLLETKKYKVVLLGGSDDVEAVDFIKKELVYSDDFIDLSQKTADIKDLAALIKSSDVLLCCDSAPMHLAVGLGAKVVSIFGPTDEKKLLPESEHFRAITNKKAKCRPCLWEYRKSTCDGLLCLDIPPTKVFNELVNLLN